MRLQQITAIAIVAACLSPSVGWAQETQVELGEDEFLDNCAVCHGVSGKGDGPLGVTMRDFHGTLVADLTMLSANNGGAFPFERVLDVIDGRAEVAIHGPREMPVWGQEFKSEASPNLSPTIQELLVRGRILALIEYLRDLQVFDGGQ